MGDISRLFFLIFCVAFFFKLIVAGYYNILQNFHLLSMVAFTVTVGLVHNMMRDLKCKEEFRFTEYNLLLWIHPGPQD